jgi:hypothetical protein
MQLGISCPSIQLYACITFESTEWISTKFDIGGSLREEIDWGYLRTEWWSEEWSEYLDSLLHFLKRPLLMQVIHWPLPNQSMQKRVYISGGGGDREDWATYRSAILRIVL